MLINMRNALMAGKRLPYDAEVEYLESDNTYAAYGSAAPFVIDTGIVPNLDTDVWECDAQFLAFGETAGCWGVTGNRFAFGRGSNTWNDWYFGLGNTNNRTGKQYDYARHTFRLDGPSRKLFIDATGYSGSGSTVSGYARTVALFQRNNTYGITYLVDHAKSRCYSSKYFRNGVLIQHLIPVRVGNVGYMYDRVSGRLFGNDGTGDFVLGPDVVPVEYIESHGTEWIDTGVVPTANTNVTIDYQTLITTGTDSNAFFGSHIAAQRSALSIMQYLTGGAIRLRWDYGSNLANFVEVRSGVHAISTVGNAATYDNAESVSGGIFAASGKSIWLFAINNNGSALVPHKGLQVYLFKIYDGSTPVRSFRPVRVGTDATSWEGAMMDVLTRRIYRNAGTGVFGYGNDI